ncbi:D-alanyl-D-alanine carboxypeptidase/D-alanyl-D-alanine-endopeptidase [Actinoallomurus spadix]|uniref:D-alanyl-D-alanine carboxypeptidase/D-alanyl-D-alanine-endopeptidase n=1 Tax=Actinoallomurus spadix TaxID=79912 RepID=A0ABP3HD94_9ACTN|nr:D-alanyl-D-alanine carboxypeptidase/D-alanyl-D-alanine-endopeptidase [Actinoallomurus spadix]MCO5985213.1 D-alanyl-D-alanine carboxypeptidase/D-alanyl-D-alanine-endopeptidase [Actinoallomurus spadix]
MSRSLKGTIAVLAGGAAVATAAVALTQTDTSTATPTAYTSGDLKADLDNILTDGRLKGASIGVIVRNAKTGAVLYDRDSDAQEIPGSNNKIETSTAAFGILGAGYRFRTSVYTRGGNLYLKGTGDPTLRAADYDKLAAAVAAKGIKKIKGSLVADDTWFDRQFTPPGWDPSDLPYSYGAGISALNVSPDDVFDAGSIGVTITPGQEGKPVNVTLNPPTSVVKVDNRATTGKAGTGSTVSVDRTGGTNTIVITGSYPADGGKEDHLSAAPNPTQYAADVFRRALTAHGVTVAGATKRAATPKTAKVVTTRRSIPLSELATPFLKLSNNQIAEILTKAIGRKVAGKGTRAAGIAATSRYLKTLGVDTTKVKQTDGSGLSRTNQTTPRQVSTILKAVQAKPWFSTWYNALPIAGQPDRLVGGTLASRMKGTPAAGNVHAKSGTLTSVTALSGYVKDDTGQPLIFSIMFNGYQGGAPKDIEDKIVVRLAAGTSVSAQNTVRKEATRSGGHLESSWTKGKATNR